MTMEASGGKAMHLPGISRSVKVFSFKNPQAWPSWSVACIFLGLFAFSLVMFLWGKHLSEASIEPSSYGPTSDGGYKVVPTSNSMLAFAIMLVGYTLPTLIALFLLLKTNFGQGILKGLILPVICFFTVMLGPYCVVQIVIPNITTPQVQSFSDWAKGKYHLSSIKGYDDKLAIDAKDANGGSVKMNVFKTPENIVYLYENSQQFDDIIKHITDTKGGQ